jgi:hypothetical protein
MLDACGQNVYRQHIALGQYRELLSALSEGPTPRTRGATMPHHHDQQAAARPRASDLAGSTTSADGVRP